MPVAMDEVIHDIGDMGHEVPAPSELKGFRQRWQSRRSQQDIADDECALDAIARGDLSVLQRAGQQRPPESLVGPEDIDDVLEACSANKRLRSQPQASEEYPSPSTIVDVVDEEKKNETSMSSRSMNPEGTVEHTVNIYACKLECKPREPSSRCSPGSLSSSSDS